MKYPYLQLFYKHHYYLNLKVLLLLFLGIPFLLMNRKGYITLSTEREVILNVLSWDYDYIITQNDFFLSDIYTTYPEIINRTNVLWNNGKISICKLNEIELNQTLEEYLGLYERVPLAQEFIDFEKEIC